jgi:hypothetical protein
MKATAFFAVLAVAACGCGGGRNDVKPGYSGPYPSSDAQTAEGSQEGSPRDL